MKKYQVIVAWVMAAGLAASVGRASEYEINFALSGSKQGNMKVDSFTGTESYLATLAGNPLQKGDKVVADIHKDLSSGTLRIRRAGSADFKLGDIIWRSGASDFKTKVVGCIEIKLVSIDQATGLNDFLILTGTVKLLKGTPVSVSGDIRGALTDFIVITKGTIKTKKISD